MPHTNALWRLAHGQVFTPALGVMGIVNITPDSFYDGGTHNTTAQALAHAARLLAEGAHILDLGAESSRPGAQPLDAEEECARLLPVLCGIRHAHPAALISIDTYHAATAARLLATGNVHILNDISACAWEPTLLDVVAHYKPGYVLMHTQGKPETMQAKPLYDNVVDAVTAFFEDGIARLTKAGLPEDRIILDPGIGFGKRAQHNMALLRASAVLQQRFNRPVLMGLSMKSLFGDVLSLPVAQRGQATQIATALLAAEGVRVHRVHDVAATVQTLRFVYAWQNA
jgi:dihydropteroate synthase